MAKKLLKKKAKSVSPASHLATHQSNLKGIARGAMAAAKWEPADEDALESHLRVHAYQLIHQLAVDPALAQVVLALWNDSNTIQIEPEDIAAQVKETARDNTAPPELIDPSAKHGRTMPLPLSQYGTTMDVDWVWEGYFAKGYVTQLVGTTTVGKTTILAWLLKYMGCKSPPALGTTVLPGKVLVLTEEDGKIWRRRAAELDGIADHVEFLHHSSIFSGRPSMQEWQDFCCWVAALVELRKYDLVIIDPWQSFNPVADENDALSNVTAVNYLRVITTEGACVVLSHHPSKTITDQTTAGRGTSATAGLADILMLMRRSGKNQFTTKRQITAWGRIGGTPPSIVLNLTEQGYEVVDDTLMAPLFGKGPPKTSARELARVARLDIITTIIRTAGRALTPLEIRAEWPKSEQKLRPSKRTLYGDLGVHDGLVKQNGKSLRSPNTYNILRAKTPPQPANDPQHVAGITVTTLRQRPDSNTPSIPAPKSRLPKVPTK